MSQRDIGAIIPAHAFITEKEHADGTFDKTKCRLVAGGTTLMARGWGRHTPL